MIFVVICAVVAILCYIMGFFTGKRYADQKIEEIRAEMQFDDNKDAWDFLFKGDNE